MLTVPILGLNFKRQNGCVVPKYGEKLEIPLKKGLQNKTLQHRKQGFFSFILYQVCHKRDTISK